MSIFKDTFPDHVQKQINARQNLISYDGPRPQAFHQYVLGKTPWVKMTSFVDYKGNSNLAKNYVLKGGTQSKIGLKRGVEGLASVSGSQAAYKQDPQFGFRPMPGITEVNVRSRDAYGSLREATVKFYAWTLEDLENLIILYMRPGYHVLLEWGFSQYLDVDDDTSPVSKYIVKTFDEPLINIFDGSPKIDTIYRKIRELNIATKGNYEGMLGAIKNFEYTLLENGGFECTTTLISLGEVISSIKMNADSGIDTNLKSSIDENKDVKDDFENALYQLAFGSAIGATTDPPIASELKNKAPNLFTSGILDDKILSFNIFPLNMGPSLNTNTQTTPAQNNTTPSNAQQDLSHNANLDPINGCYIQLAYFIHFINQKHNLFIKNGEKYIDFEIPVNTLPSNFGNGLCLASDNSMTIDNSSCIIFNPYALFNNKNFIGNNGFDPFMVNSRDVNSGKANMKNYIYHDSSQKSYGIIGNIYVNIGKILSIYRSVHKQNKGQVFFGPLMKGILGEIEYALGSINSFDIFTIDNKCVIMDKHYIDPNPNNKFVLNILGNNTIARDHKVHSRIYQEQSSMIAIAAQDRENLGSYQTSTYVAMNKNLKDRLVVNMDYTDPVSKNDSDQLAKEKNIFINNCLVLFDYVRDYILTGTPPLAGSPTLSSLNTFLNSLLVRLERATDYKGIVPMALEVKLDGIAGIIIGDVFKLNASVLPREYRDKSVGFIVTGLSHNIVRADWTTTITAQFCLLDDHARNKKIKNYSNQFYNDAAARVTQNKVAIENAAKSYNILMAFIHDFFADEFNIVETKNLNKISIHYPTVRSLSKPKILKAIANSYSISGNDELDLTQDIAKLTYYGAANNQSISAPTGFFNVNSQVNNTDDIPITTYLNRYGNPGVNNYEDIDYMKTVYNYISEVVKRNKYYYNMQAVPEIQSKFDADFAFILQVYSELYDRFRALVKMFTTFTNPTIFIRPGIIDPSFLTAYEGIHSDVVIHYLNPNSYDTLGKLDTAKLSTNSTLIITFDDHTYKKDAIHSSLQ
jgi:hypothetical protein